MKRRLTIFLSMIVFLFTLTACVVPWWFDVVLKENVSWSSENGEFYFEIQGTGNKWEGFGYLMINGEKSDELFFDIHPPTQKIIVRKKVDSKYETILTAHISSIKTGRFRQGVISNRMELEPWSNDLGDDFFNEPFEITRTDLEPSQLNARNYYSVTWINFERKFSIYTYGSDEIDPLSRIWNGHIEREPKELIKFHFKTDDKFEIYRENILVAKGSYITNKDELKLIFEMNGLFSNQEEIMMVIKHDI
ncbi:MAG TPA: hypothetical protein GX003_04380 [Acholeplasmataceae bacterium]|jgi:hypothetical protein|nr:hypothetical protein [Acholeplasmataceae bacterium]